MEKMEKEKDRQDLEIESIIQVREAGINNDNPTIQNMCVSFMYHMTVFCSMHGNWKAGEGRRRSEKGGDRGRCRWSWRGS